MVREVKNLTNIKLTESDEDGIWLHFEGGGLKAGLSLSLNRFSMHGEIADRTIRAWAREQLDREVKPVVRSKKFVENAPRKSNTGGVRPSPPVDGGY